MDSKNKITVSTGNGLPLNFLVITLTFFFLQEPFAQQFPDTIWIPVTFYDFHSDKSNPEFEADHNGGLHKGMVADTLNANKKPVLGSKPFFNYYIHKWFEPWQAGDFTIPEYEDRNGVDHEIVTVTYDTAFKNIVIKDSLPFIHIGDGVYQFERSGQNRTGEFFWLDDRGFGNERKSNNYSFTMELHTTFTYNRGLTFEFLGDDDVWAFIDGKLAMDIGGIHVSLADEIDLDEIADSFELKAGRKYDFDFFYAERHTSNSRIKITTNLFTPMANLRLYSKPGNPDQQEEFIILAGDTIAAGEQFTIYGHAFDTLGWREDWDNLINLELVDPQNRAELISGGNGSITIFPKAPFTAISITATFINPEDPYAKPIKSTVQLVIGPGDAVADSSVTGDADGDGYLDWVDVHFNSKVAFNQKTKEAFEVHFRGTPFKIDSISPINDGAVVRLFLEEKITDQLQTDWKPLVNIMDIKGLAPVSDMESKDGAGPVVNKASFHSGSLSSEQSVGTADSIRVTISELIGWPASAGGEPNRIFRLYHNNNIVQNPFTSMIIVNDSSAILIVSDKITVDAGRDSIQLNSSGGVTDKPGNRPHIDSRKAAIEWGVITLQYIPSNNPFSPGITEIDPRIRQRFAPVIKRQTKVSGGTGTKGTIIRLEVKGKPLKVVKVDSRIDSAYGRVAIYDVVGNLVRSDLYVFKVEGNDYGIYWDGYNKKGRAVGRGTYLFSVVTTDVDNKTDKKQFKIGVTRKTIK